MRILLAEDEKSIAITLRDALEEVGHRVEWVADGREARDELKRVAYDALVSDIRMPGLDGMQLLAFARTLEPAPAVVMITGYATVEQAVDAMQKGAETYVQKPFPNAYVVRLLEQIQRRRTLESANQELRRRLDHGQTLDEIVGRSRAMTEMLERLRTVAPTEASILITGQSGTGKERVARAIHRLSARAEGPFVALSCAMLTESLLEAELFGHERGAFTDAHRERKGRFEMAHGGTIFLDDVDDAPLSVQVKLLRVLEEHEVQRVGGDRVIPVDLRVVTATKVDLQQLVRAGRFREDLYYRLNVVPIDLPPLAQREGDVPLLIEHFLKKYGAGRDYQVKPDVMEALQTYLWPGNVRELENSVARAVALSGGATFLKKEHLLPLSAKFRSALDVGDGVRPLREVLRDTEREYIARVLKTTAGHRTQAADLLGISRKVLWEKIRDLGISDPRASNGGESAP
jgi:DNA-binding NtrC family response regulator